MTDRDRKSRPEPTPGSRLGPDVFDRSDLGRDYRKEDPLAPLNPGEKPRRQTAVAIRDAAQPEDLPEIIASGRGHLAEEILKIAFENDVKVRKDAALAEILASVDLDSPIPNEAFMAVAEILSYVYQANGMPDPFNAVLDPGRAADTTQTQGKPTS